MPIIGPIFGTFVGQLSPTDRATLEAHWATIEADPQYSGPQARRQREIALIVFARTMGLP